MNVKKYVFLLVITALACAGVADAQSVKSGRTTKSKRAAKIKPAANPQSSPQPGTASGEKAAVETQAAQPVEPQRITVEELKEKLAKNEPVFIIDSRSQGSYDGTETKIKGAVRIPMDDVESRLNEIPRDKEIVVYCT